MEQATRLRQPRLGDYLERAWREGALWAVVILSLYLVLALATYSPDDPGWSFVGAEGAVNNTAGRLGAWFADLTLFLVGVFAYLIPVALAASAFLVFREHEPEPETKLYWLVLRWSGLLLTLGAGAGLASLQIAEPFGDLPNGIGGAFGLLIADTASAGFGLGGGSLVLLGLLLTGLSLFTGLSPLLIVDGIGDLTLLLLRLPPHLYQQIQAARAERRQHPPHEDWEHEDWETDWTTDWNAEDDEIEIGPEADLAPKIDKEAHRDAEADARGSWVDEPWADELPTPSTAESMRTPRNAIHTLAASQPSTVPLVGSQPNLQIGIGAGFEAASVPVRVQPDVAVRTNISEPEPEPEPAIKTQAPQPAPAPARTRANIGARIRLRASTRIDIGTRASARIGIRISTHASDHVRAIAHASTRAIAHASARTQSRVLAGDNTLHPFSTFGRVRTPDRATILGRAFAGAFAGASHPSH